MERVIFRVKLNKNLDWGYAPGSFKLTLRAACKDAAQELYFSNPPVEGVKNMGCYVFGQPDVWASIIRFMPGENPGEVKVEWDIFRAPRDGEIRDKILTLLKRGLELLRREGVIEDYE